MQHRRKAMLNDLFMLVLFGALLLASLLYLIFRYVRSDLEAHRLVEAETALFNRHAFVEECTRSSIAAVRNGTIYSVLMMRFSEKKTDRRSVEKIVEQLKKSCRREEKLFRIADAEYALIAADTRKSDLAPLTERLRENLSAFRESFACEILEYAPDTDPEAFAAACLAKTERIGTSV